LKTRQDSPGGFFGSSRESSLQCPVDIPVNMALPPPRLRNE
jgi:hypothetical protein